MFLFYGQEEKVSAGIQVDAQMSTLNIDTVVGNIRVKC